MVESGGSCAVLRRGCIVDRRRRAPHEFGEFGLVEAKRRNEEKRVAERTKQKAVRPGQQADTKAEPLIRPAAPSFLRRIEFDGRGQAPLADLRHEGMAGKGSVDQ